MVAEKMNQKEWGLFYYPQEIRMVILNQKL